MTPKELCDIAAKINAAVPGLVPPYEVGEAFHDKYVATRDRHGWEYNPLPGAAALMLGLCWAWVRRRGDDDPPDMALVAIMECYVALRDYVQSTLPGAKQ